MLAIRLQRTGRKGHAMFRVVVQDSRRTPSSGKVVANLGSYDPHAKRVSLDKDKAGFYLEHGAQPSDRAAHLLKEEGVKLPAWVRTSSDQQRTVRNPDKRRSTRPAEEVMAEPPSKTADTGVDQAAAEAPTAEDQAADTDNATAETAETEDKTENS